MAHYFRDVYLFCVQKEAGDPSKLRPLGIPAAMRRVLASHAASTLRQRFATALAPLNLCVGVEGGMDFIVTSTQLGVDKFITEPLNRSELPSRIAILLDLRNMFNKVSREVFMEELERDFPELVPLANLFYEEAGTVHFRWEDGTWDALKMEEGSTQGCPLSVLFAALVMRAVLRPVLAKLDARAA